MVGDDFYSLAVTLSAGSTPAEHRSSISRAYYGAYHNACEFLKSIGVTLKGGGNCHEIVPQIFENSGDPDVATVGGRLRAFKQTRNTADYNLSNGSFDKKPKAVLELHNASVIIADIKKLRPTGARTPIHEKIRQYAKFRGEIVN
jgi:uncharacterized protein (UPF0332 family)